MSEPGILVLTDAFYPGWKVRVDGEEQKILRANYLFRAVALPAGNHKVEFIYDPASFKVGLMISLGTAGLLVTVALIGWFRRRARVADVPKNISERPVTLVAE
ncbi:MAG: YfhO family protein [Nitrospira sp.]|nr:YfhO family protein [Nitrospira sp.]